MPQFEHSFSTKNFTFVFRARGISLLPRSRRVSPFRQFIPGNLSTLQLDSQSETSFFVVGNEIALAVSDAENGPEPSSGCKRNFQRSLSKLYHLTSLNIRGLNSILFFDTVQFTDNREGRGSKRTEGKSGDCFDAFGKLGPISTRRSRATVGNAAREVSDGRQTIRIGTSRGTSETTIRFIA